MSLSGAYISLYILCRHLCPSFVVNVLNDFGCTLMSAIATYNQLQWSLSCKTPCCKTDLSYVTALLPLQVVFSVQNAPRYETAPPRETASGLQKGRSYNAGTTVGLSNYQKTFSLNLLN